MEESVIKTALQAFFLANVAEEESSRQCKLCFVQSSNGKVGKLSSDVVKVFQYSLLLQVTPLKTSSRSLIWVCGECEASLETFSDLFFQLEKLRTQFNDLRKKISREVVVRSLGKSQEEWETFYDNEIKPSEDYYPSVCLMKPENDLNVIVKEEPVDILPDYKQQSQPNEQWESPWTEEITPKKDYNPEDGADEEVPIMNFVEEEPPEEQFILLGPQVQNVKVEEQIEDLILVPDVITNSENCVDIHYEDIQNPARRDDDDSDSLAEEDSDSEQEFHPKVIYSDDEQSSSSFMDSNNDNSTKSRSGQSKKSTEKNNERVKCSHCEETFANRFSRNRHIKLIHDEKRRLKKLVQAIKRDAKSRQPKTYSCSTCKKIFERYDKAWRCNNKHKGPFSCTICKASFVYSKGRARHMRSAHKDVNKSIVASSSSSSPVVLHSGTL